MKTVAIGNIVYVDVKFTLKDGRVNKMFSFTFTAERLDQHTIQERLEDKENKVPAFMADVITDWEHQRLVLEEDGTPSNFSVEALEAMLNVMGVAGVMFAAYFKACPAKEKN